MSHSPGPWKWVKGAWDLRALTDADDKVILEAGSSQDMHVYDEQAGALIASAPELLSMLRELEWADESDCGPFCPCCQHPKLGLFPRDHENEAPSGHALDCRLASLLGRFPK